MVNIRAGNVNIWPVTQYLCIWGYNTFAKFKIGLPIMIFYTLCCVLKVVKTQHTDFKLGRNKIGEGIWIT